MYNKYAHLPHGIAKNRNPWRPGAFARLPWLGLGALVGTIAGVAASIAILVASDGVSILEWSFQPTVYLSITSTVTNVMIFFALSEGVTAAWWSRALKQDTEVSDLHHYWAVGNSFLAAVTSGRKFNLIALASIFAALAPINGPLLQRASHVVVRTASTEVNLTVVMAPEIPKGFTGLLEGRGHNPALLNRNFTPVVADYYNRADININATGCNGVCTTNLAGTGFNVNCSQGLEAFNKTPSLFANGTIDMSPFVGTDVFVTKFEWDVGLRDTLYSKTKYKPEPGCTGNLIVRNCTLRAATVNYSTIIDSNKSSISLAPASTIYEDAVLGITTIPDDDYTPGGNSTLGGLFLALANRFDSAANLRWAGAIGYEISTSGAIAHQFIIPQSTSEGQFHCEIAFTDPTDNMLANTRELMFRTAVAAANAANTTNIQQVRATQKATIAVYVSSYLYLGIACLLTILAILLIVPTFYGYWYIGRNVSMSPVEIAKAFNAPLLRNEDSNAEAADLIKAIGHRRIRYGLVSADYADSIIGAEAIPMEEISLSFTRRTLEMAPPDKVIEPQRGWTFAG
jgi:hypothetical protein